MNQAHAHFHGQSQTVRISIWIIITLCDAVGMGFTQFGDNIQKHLVSGLVMWLTGGMREEPIRLPDKWDLKGEQARNAACENPFKMEVLGLGWANLRKKLVKQLGEQAMGLAEKGLDIVMKLFTEGPIAMWDKFRGTQEFEKPLKIGEELKGEIFAAVREMMIIEIIKQGVIFLLSLTNPASGIVKAIKAFQRLFPILRMPRIVLWFFNNIHRIIEMAKKVFEASANIVEGNLGGAANATVCSRSGIERIMGLTIPVIIDLFLSILGLSGLPKKVMGVIKRVGGKLNALIDKLLLKVVGEIKKMFGGKKGGGKKGGGKKDPKKDDKNKLMAVDKRKHEQYLDAIKKELAKPEKKKSASFEEFYKGKKKLSSDLEKRYNKKLTKIINGKRLKTKVTMGTLAKDEKDNDLDIKITIAPNDATENLQVPFEEAEIPNAVVTPGYNSAQASTIEVKFLANVPGNHEHGSPAEVYTRKKGNTLNGALTILEDMGLRSKWVAFHLINEQVGGKAVASNLTPTHRDDNMDYKDNFEKRQKNNFLNERAKNVIWWNAEVTYRDEAFPSKVKAKGGKMKFDPSSNTWVPNKKDIKTWSATIREPQPEELKINKLARWNEPWKEKWLKKTLGNTGMKEALFDTFKPFAPFNSKAEMKALVDTWGLSRGNNTAAKTQIDNANIKFD